MDPARGAAATALIMLALLAASATAAAGEDSGKGVAVLQYQVTDLCGGQLQAGEEGLAKILLLYLPGQAAAEYVNITLRATWGGEASPSTLLWGPVLLPGDSKLFEIRLKVPPSTPPGLYRLEANYTVIYLDGSRYRGSFAVAVPLRGCPSHGLRVHARLEPFNYPGTNGARLVVELENPGNETLRNATARLVLPPGWRPRSSFFELGVLGANRSTTLRVEDVYVPAWLRPGVYTARLELNYTCSLCGRNTTFTQEVPVEIRVDAAPPLHIALLGAAWRDGYAYVDEKGARLDIRIQVLEPLRVTGLNYSLSLPPGFRASPGTRLRGFTATQLGYGDAALLGFQVDTPRRPGCYRFNLTLYARVEDNGTTTWRPAAASSELCVSRPRLALQLLQAYWSTWVVGERGYGLTARLRLLYRGNDTLTGLTLNATALPPAGVRGNTSSPISYTTPATSGTVITLDVAGVTAPRNASSVTIMLRGVATASTPSGGSYTAPVELEAVLPLPRERPLRLIWYNYTPPVVLPGAGTVSVKLRFEANTTAPLRILWAEPRGLPPGVAFLGASGGCLDAVLAPGSACSLTMNMNVSNRAAPGRWSYRVAVSLTYQASDGLVEVVEVFTLRLKVGEPGRYVPRLELVDAHWVDAAGNPVQVLPGDRDAALRVTLYNPGPFAVSSLRARLEGWESTSSTCQAVPAGGFCTLTLYVTPPRRPGPRPTLLLAYRSTIYGATVEARETLGIEVAVADPREAFNVTGVEWLTPPEPGSRTAKLGVALEPDPRLVASIVSVKLELPDWLASPQTGLHTVELRRASSGPPGWLLRSARGGNAAALVQLLARQGETAATAGARYEAEVAVSPSAPGTGSTARLVIAWRSPHGSLHVNTYNVTLPPPVSASTLIVWSKPRSPMRGGVANFTVYVANRGNGVAYDAYLYLAPLSRTGFPTRPVIALGSLRPGEVREVTVPIVFNPSTFAGEKSYTFAAMAALVYDDQLGFRRFVNATVSSIMEPVVRVVVKSARVRIEGGDVVATGVLANTGLDPASSVAVTLRVGNRSASEFLGNMDPGTETPFKVVLRGAAGQAKHTGALINVTYMDQYGYSYRVGLRLAAEEAGGAAPAAVQPRVEKAKGGPAVGRLAEAAAGVAIGFAAGVAVSRRRRHSGETVEEEEV